MKIGVPAGNPTSLNHTEEDVVVTGSLKRNLKPEPVAIKCERLGHAFYDEKGSDTGNFSFCHILNL